MVAAVSLLALGAFALRLYGLARQSLWLDEGASFAIASSPVSAIFDQTFASEPNPPLYYLCLHAWISVAGSSEFALRFFSVAAGVALVPVMYRLGDLLGGKRLGLLAALLAAGSPYLVWYSQEARMYALLALLAASSGLALVAVARASSRRRWLVFFVLCLATLYTHLYGLFSVGALVIASFAASRGRKNIVPPVLCAVGLGVAYAPWVLATYAHRSQVPSWRAGVDPMGVLLRSASSFAHGTFLSGSVADATTWTGLGLAVIGAAAGFRLGRRSGLGSGLGALLVTLPIVVPLLSAYLASRAVPMYAERYVAGVAPFYYLAVAASVTYARRSLVAVVLAGAGVALFVPALHASWTDAQFVKEDFRSAASFVQERAREDDVVVVAAPYVEMPFRYYYHGAAKVVPFGGDYANPEAFLGRELAGKSTAWLVTSHLEDVDPDRKLRAWLGARFPGNTEAYPKGIHINAYNVGYPPSVLPSDATPADVHFEGGLTLVGYRTDKSLAPSDARLHPPSNWLHVTLFWKAEEQPNSDYVSEVYLLDKNAGIWGGKLRRPSDVGTIYPAKQRSRGQIAVDDVDVNINPATPPGQYLVAVGLLDSSGKPAVVLDSTGRVTDKPLRVLGPVTIAAQ